MTICPRCERLIRNGDMVRVSILGEFIRVDAEGHSIAPYDEEWVEHITCVPEAWEQRFVRWIRRQWRWVRECIFRGKWGA